MQTTTEWLKYEFTEAEQKELAKKLAYATRELMETEEAKKAVTSNFKSKIEAAKEQISKLSNNINNGYEYRNIDCEVVLNSPEPGTKSIVRKDTGEIVKTLEMDQEEKQEKLFEEDK